MGYKVGSQISKVCNYLIDKGITNERPLSNISLQKLLYFAQGIHLANRDGNPLFEEDFYAWRFGPVVESVYHEFKSFGNNSIAPEFFAPPFYSKTSFDKKYASFLTELEKDHRICLDVTYNAFGHFSPFELVNISHQKNSPWEKVYNEKHNQLIEKSLIEKYFLKTYLS